MYMPWDSLTGWPLDPGSPWFPGSPVPPSVPRFPGGPSCPGNPFSPLKKHINNTSQEDTWWQQQWGWCRAGGLRMAAAEGAMRMGGTRSPPADASPMALPFSLLPIKAPS